MTERRDDPWADTIVLPTPEGVELELTLAGLGSRVAAGIIDLLIQAFGYLALTVVVFAALDDPPGVVVAGYTVASFLILFGYNILFETVGSGRTPGKRLIGLRVIRSEGLSVGFVASAVRNLVRIVDFLPAFYTVGTIFILFNGRHQRLGDLAAGTLVVRERSGDRKAAPGVTTTTGPATQGWDVSGITTEDLTTVRRFLDRRETLTSEARDKLALRLAEKLRPRVAGAPPDLRSEAFLEALAAAKSARI